MTFDYDTVLFDVDVPSSTVTERTVMIGDTPYDFEAAARARCSLHRAQKRWLLE